MEVVLEINSHPFFLDENSTRDANPRIFSVKTGKDSQAVSLSDFNVSDWMISNVHSVEMNSTGSTGEYKLYLELNEVLNPNQYPYIFLMAVVRMLRLNSQKDLIPLLWLMN